MIWSSRATTATNSRPRLTRSVSMVNRSPGWASATIGVPRRRPIGTAQYWRATASGNSWAAPGAMAVWVRSTKRRWCSSASRLASAVAVSVIQRAAGRARPFVDAVGGIGNRPTILLLPHGGPLGPAGPGPWCPVPLCRYERNPRVSANWGPSPTFSLAKQALLTKRGGLTSQRDGAQRAGQSDRRRGQRRGRRVDRLVPERGHLPGAAPHVDRPSPFALPPMWDRARRGRERACHLLGGAPGTVPPLPRADLGALSRRGADRRRAVRRLFPGPPLVRTRSPARLPGRGRPRRGRDRARPA